MSDRVDAFCPGCGHNIGPGTLDSIGCPLCGHSASDENDSQRVVLRISRHEATDSHIAALKAAFGNDIDVVTKDVAYGEDPVSAVEAVIRGFEVDLTTIIGQVVAVEAAGPESVLQALVERLDVPVIRPAFRRENGRVVVVGKDTNGRDIFDVEHYERLDVEMRPALVAKPL